MPPVPPRLRVGFADGVTPDKWGRAWRSRRREPLELVPLGDRDGVALLHDGALEMCLVRLPVEPSGLHVVTLYDEQPVVVAAREHPVAAYESIDASELADEPILEGPAASTVGAAAADQGIVVLPMSVARLHHRRDVVAVPVTGLPVTTVALAWPVAADDELTQAFVGVVRGRTANSSRR